MQILLNLLGRSKNESFSEEPMPALVPYFLFCCATTLCSGLIFPKTSILVILDHTRYEVHLLQHIGIDSPNR